MAYRRRSPLGRRFLTCQRQKRKSSSGLKSTRRFIRRVKTTLMITRRRMKPLKTIKKRKKSKKSSKRRMNKCQKNRKNRMKKV
jgi:hypothetical protein